MHPVFCSGLCHLYQCQSSCSGSLGACAWVCNRSSTGPAAVSVARSLLAALLHTRWLVSFSTRFVHGCPLKTPPPAVHVRSKMFKQVFSCGYSSLQSAPKRSSAFSKCSRRRLSGDHSTAKNAPTRSVAVQHCAQQIPAPGNISVTTCQSQNGRSPCFERLFER